MGNPTPFRCRHREYSKVWISTMVQCSRTAEFGTHCAKHTSPERLAAMKARAERKAKARL